MRIKSLAVIMLLWALTGTASAAQRICETFNIPVTYAGVPNAMVWGELCRPKHNPWPNTVQFLVHGSTHNHHYWDFPFLAKRYSHVEGALEGGFATFNIDRIGTGQSTIPASNLVTVDATVDSLHQLVAGLRSGAIGGHAFSQVVYFGSSLSTAYGWQLAASYPGDIDAFVFTGLLHETTPYWLNLVQNHIIPANQDPLFQDKGLDAGYVTTEPGWRATFFINTANTNPHVPAVDELMKGEVSASLMWESALRYVVNPDPQTSVARSIGVPVLITIGDQDGPSCGEGGVVCTPENILAFESPFYSQSPSRVLDVYVAPNTKHAIPVHDSFRETKAVINAWLHRHLRCR